MGCAARRWMTSMNIHYTVRRVEDRWIRHQATSNMVWIGIVVNNNSPIIKTTGAFRPSRIAKRAPNRHPKTKAKIKISASAPPLTLPKANPCQQSLNGSLDKLLRKMRNSLRRMLVSGRNATSSSWRQERMSAVDSPLLPTARTMTTKQAIHSIFLLFLLWKTQVQLTKQLQMPLITIRRRSTEQLVMYLLSIYKFEFTINHSLFAKNGSRFKRCFKPKMTFKTRLIIWTK